MARAQPEHADSSRGGCPDPFARCMGQACPIRGSCSRRACQCAVDHAHHHPSTAGPAGERSISTGLPPFLHTGCVRRREQPEERASAHGSRPADVQWSPASRALAGGRSSQGRHVAHTRICDLFPCLTTERNAILALNVKERQCISGWESMPYCDRSIYNLTDPHLSSSIHNKELVKVVSAKADA